MQQQQLQVQPTVLLGQPPPVDNKLKPASASALTGLSVTQIVMGILCITMGITLIPLDQESYYTGSGIAAIGYGIWIGLLFIVLGIIGVAAAKTNKTCLITGALVLNILYSAMVSIALLSFTSIGLIFSSSDNCRQVQSTYLQYVSGSYEYNYWSGQYEYSGGYYATRTRYTEVCEDGRINDVFWALDGLMLLMGLIEFIITIVSSAICCGAICRCCKVQVGTTVLYHSRPQQVFVQPVLYPSIPNNSGYAFNQPGIAQQPTFYPAASMSPSRHPAQPAAVHTTPGYSTQYLPAHNTVPPQHSNTHSNPSTAPQPVTPEQPPEPQPPQNQPTAPLSGLYEDPPPPPQRRVDVLPPIRNITLTGPQPEPPRYSSLK